MEDLEGDKELYRYRHIVHCYLDTLWLISSNKSNARSSLYKWLAVQMDKNTSDLHISNFDLTDCKQALYILKVKYKQLTGKKNIPKSIIKQFHHNDEGKYDKSLINKLCKLNSNKD